MALLSYYVLGTDCCVPTPLCIEDHTDQLGLLRHKQGELQLLDRRPFKFLHY